MKGKRSTFLSGLKRRNKSPRHEKLRPNSTKVGQGEGYVNRAFDVNKKRSEQDKGGSPNGLLSRWSLSLKRKALADAKKK